MAEYKNYLLVCGGTGCHASRSAELADELTKQIKIYGLENDAKVILTGCFGFCEKGPNVKMVPDNTFYTKVKPEDAEEIVKEHLLKGRKVQRLLYLDPDTNKHVTDDKHMEFYKKQVRIALRNCGFIDPDNIQEAVERDAYAA
ncbi:MAG: (2Fe-2S) ferredoxin domain-containing protein, partial [Bacteroidales bacterium]